MGAVTGSTHVRTAHRLRQHGTGTVRAAAVGAGRRVADDDQLIRVVIVDDHALLRAALAGVVDAESDMKTIGAAATAMAGVELALRDRPDVIVMDENLPDLNGDAASRLIIADWPTAVIVTLGHFEGIAEPAAGERGEHYLDKTEAIEQLAHLIRTAHLAATRCT